MAFAPLAELPAYIRVAENRFSLAPSTSNLYDFTANSFDLFAHELHNVIFGKTVYPLRVPALHGFFTPPHSGRDGLFRVEELSFVNGAGEDVTTALNDWTEKFHILVQTMIAKRPFEMTSDEMRQWEAISSHVDIAAYLDNLLVKVRRLGVVRDMRRGHYAVEWDSGEIQQIRLSQMPDSFAAFRPGQPFEAIVVYRPDGLDFVAVEFIAKRSVRRASPTEQREIWNSLSTSRDLPAAAW
jgi:hypothetical protein